MEGWKARVRLGSTQKKCLHFDSSDVEKKKCYKILFTFCNPMFGIHNWDFKKLTLYCDNVVFCTSQNLLELM
jgi:hypothetical protein